MPQEERKEILEALESVDEVFISKHPKNPDDMNVSSELKEINHDIFTNGGDRAKENQTEENIAELEICRSIGCKVAFKEDYPYKRVEDLIPEEIYQRPKMGFTFPFQKWLSEYKKGHWSRYWSEKIAKEFR